MSTNPDIIYTTPGSHILISEEPSNASYTIGALKKELTSITNIDNPTIDDLYDYRGTSFGSEIGKHVDEIDYQEKYLNSFAKSENSSTYGKVITFETISQGKSFENLPFDENTPGGKLYHNANAANNIKSNYVDSKLPVNGNITNTNFKLKFSSSRAEDFVNDADLIKFLNKYGDRVTKTIESDGSVVIDLTNLAGSAELLRIAQNHKTSHVFRNQGRTNFSVNIFGKDAEGNVYNTNTFIDTELDLATMSDQYNLTGYIGSSVVESSYKNYLRKKNGVLKYQKDNYKYSENYPDTYYSSTTEIMPYSEKLNPFIYEYVVYNALYNRDEEIDKYLNDGKIGEVNTQPQLVNYSQSTFTNAQYQNGFVHGTIPGSDLDKGINLADDNLLNIITGMLGANPTIFTHHAVNGNELSTLEKIKNTNFNKGLTTIASQTLNTKPDECTIRYGRVPGTDVSGYTITFPIYRSGNPNDKDIETTDEFNSFYSIEQNKGILDSDKHILTQKTIFIPAKNDNYDSLYYATDYFSNKLIRDVNTTGIEKPIISRYRYGDLADSLKVSSSNKGLVLHIGEDRYNLDAETLNTVITLFHNIDTDIQNIFDDEDTQHRLYFDRDTNVLLQNEKVLNCRKKNAKDIANICKLLKIATSTINEQGNIKIIPSALNDNGTTDYTRTDRIINLVKDMSKRDYTYWDE